MVSECVPFQKEQGAIILSIVSIRKAMETKGCQAVLVVIGILMVVGMVASGFFNGQSVNPQEQAENATVFTVAGKKVSAKEFSARVAEYAQQQQYGQGTAVGELTTVVAAIGSYVQTAATASLAQQKGVQVDEAGVRAAAERAAKSQVEQYREQMTQMGMIKAGDPADAFEKKFAEMLKQTPDAFVSSQVESILKRFADPKSKDQVVAAVQQELVRDAYMKTAAITEEELKRGYEQYTFETIRFDDLGKPLTDRETQAKEAQAKAAAGDNFAALQKQYAPKAKPEERQSKLTRAIMENTPEMKALLELKPGAVSGVVMSGGSPVIFKLVKVDPNLPANFEAEKAKLLENARGQKGTEDFAKEYKAKLDSFKPKFEDKALEIAYDLGMGLNDPENALSPDKQKSFLEGIKSRLQDPATSSMNYSNLISAAEFLVAEQLYQIAPELEKPALMEDRISAANRMLEFFEDASFRISFADELLKAKKNDDAYLMAYAAAQNNGDFGPSGEQVYQQLSQMTLGAAQTKAWTDDQVKTMRAELERWQTDHQREQEELKKNEEEQKNAQKELDKDLVPEGGAKPEDQGAGSKPADPAPKEGTEKAKAGN